MTIIKGKYYLVHGRIYDYIYFMYPVLQPEEIIKIKNLKHISKPFKDLMKDARKAGNPTIRLFHCKAKILQPNGIFKTCNMVFKLIANPPGFFQLAENYCDHFSKSLMATKIDEKLRSKAVAKAMKWPA